MLDLLVMVDAGGCWPVDIASDPTLRASFDLLRTKWGEVPAGQTLRTDSQELLTLSDRELVERWDEYFRNASVFDRRGWRHLLYKDVFYQKRVLDLGCGLAFDTICYALHGAQVTFVDIVLSNVDVVRRLCRLKKLTQCEFCYLEDLTSLSALAGYFDAIYCCGSLINAPLEVVRLEAQALLKYLPVGGRWLELAYPKARWVREGRLPSDRWGERTDGGAPWMEWHDLEKIRGYLEPAVFDVVLQFEFHHSDFNWFDLVRRA